MGLFDRVEGKLERAYNGLFARAFRAEVQPVEIASAIRRAMDDRATGTGKGRSVVPNLFTIELSETDYERLTDFGDDVSDELVVAAEEHVASQHYTPGGPVRIMLAEDSDLETGVFRVRPSTVKRPDATGRTGQQPRITPQAPPPARHHVDEDDEYDDFDEYRESDQDVDFDEEPTRGAPPPAPAPAKVAPAPVAPAPVIPPRKPRRPAHRPSLVIDGDDYPLTSAITILGRDDDADIILDDPGISRRHTELRVSIDGPGFITVIRDLGSTNGTFVNGERIDSEHLQDGDRVTVGRTSMTYRVRSR
ncbi:MAG TPA: DUF3662 and FHA domain-containing protein [Phycicoccus sp.]|nr:DUF3662 and FHA domain-containing protein [Phycicoccus sp.]HQH07597.1 DUF3662 and FHA domain-containing protein [Phycicoccus sp.]HQK31636.1 DUF3662 and FHA domain-containing protein [Phycicoccus sp.]HQV92100.1 DUF3662 and FHA domain-containing protein [Phycicoccus sp.]HQY95831.1 DUF3662 and FHA domain-containing protein [Phycicoccus sp.]